jgi:dCMP deaminase
MTDRAAVAYIPVLHEGYRRFIESHARGGRLYVVGPELHAEYGPLAKDIRALPAELAASAIAAWGVCEEVAELDAAGARALAAEHPRLTMPAEDVSYRLAERFFERCEVRFDAVFLRWDKTRTAQLLSPQPRRVVAPEDVLADLGPAAKAVFAELAGAAESAAVASIDWWRRVGAAIRFADGEVRAACNVHNPHPASAYAAGDPRSNFYKGVGWELSTATHAEARLIAQAAREGRATAGAVLYVTDFPCPSCAKLIAAAGIARLYFREGYAVLDGQDVLESAGIEVVQAA